MGFCSIYPVIKIHLNMSLGDVMEQNDQDWLLGDVTEQNDQEC